MPLRLFLAFVVLGTSLAGAKPAQPRDATSVLADMRQALGGDAVLDQIKTFALEGTATRTVAGRGRANDLEVLALLPDHYLEIRRDSGVGPGSGNITYFDGFASDRTIRRTDASIPFPPDPGPTTPDAIAAREKHRALSARQSFARMALVLFGRHFDSYPLEFTYVGIAKEDGRIFEVVDARAADGYVMRLAVDQHTHLPGVLSWIGPVEFITSTTSTVTTRNGQVVGRVDDPPPPLPTQAPAPAVRRLVLSEFKLEDGVNWPRLFWESSPVTNQEIKRRRVKLNPRIEVRRFDIR